MVSNPLTKGSENKIIKSYKKKLKNSAKLSMRFKRQQSRTIETEKVINNRSRKTVELPPLEDNNQIEIVEVKKINLSVDDNLGEEEESEEEMTDPSYQDEQETRAPDTQGHDKSVFA